MWVKCFKHPGKREAENRLKVLSSVRFLARQGCGIRGHDEADGNFFQLLKLCCEDDSQVRHIYIYIIILRAFL